MNRDDGQETPFQKELTKVEMIAGLRNALDLRYRRLCQAARSDWERLFGDNDAGRSEIMFLEIAPATQYRFVHQSINVVEVNRLHRFQKLKCEMKKPRPIVR